MLTCSKPLPWHSGTFASRHRALGSRSLRRTASLSPEMAVPAAQTNPTNTAAISGPARTLTFACMGKHVKSVMHTITWLVVTLAEWAAKGPLLAQCGFRSEDILAQPDRWVDLGQYLGSSLGYDGWEQLNEFERWVVE